MINDFLKGAQGTMKDTVKVINLKSNLINAEKLLKIAFENLGKAIYLKEGGVSTPLIMEETPNLESPEYYTNLINELVKTINEIQEEIDEARGLRRCDSCGCMVPTSIDRKSVV